MGLAAAPFGVHRMFLGFNEVVIDISPTHVQWAASLFAKHTAIRANTLVDLVVYDRPSYRTRFTLIYILFSFSFQTRIRLRTGTNTNGILSTVCFIYNNANWSEREVMDMFGVRFFGHPDIRRLLADYGFWGFPGRRDFPLIGTLELLFSNISLRVSRVRLDYYGTSISQLIMNPYQKTLCQS